MTRPDALVTPVASASMWVLAGLLIVAGVSTVALVVMELVMELVG